MMFLFTELKFKKNYWTSFHGPPLCQIRLYQPEDNQLECFRLGNWFFLWCMGQWINHLPPVWWSNFRFMFLYDNCSVHLIVERNFLLISCLCVLYITHALPNTFLSHIFYNNLYIKYFVLTYSIDVTSTLSYQTARISLIISILCDEYIVNFFQERELLLKHV